ncbi:Phosphodiest-domain-containing protein [Rhizopogon vinicolor AM-OR11-026]|uniref:Phosphodiest-domain-containing protein n=1 Tax=Rhizopogon vinicolor AM-OR11-026 TaxID=1314800 RepID=A0A1B7MXV6_9AGAM|nr:Phosphodiest-domain-containing protein [Rhizopogon vinicolor AM-OR11-026]
MTNARDVDLPASPDERRSLLSNVDVVLDDQPEFEEKPTSPALSSKKRKPLAGFLFLLSLILAITGFELWPRSQHDTRIGRHALYSNGTHEFKKTVLMVSIDGFRADYLDRGLTPHLLDISREGLRAKYMRPVFPTLTFPNHWTLLTGLWAESHGIVANDFWDPVFREPFHYYNVTSTKNPRWWLGEPIWETAERAGIITANLMWAGPWIMSSGVKPTYFLPWVEQPLQTKLSKLLEWIDLPLEVRPQLILGYDPSVDHAGHETGPMSEAVNTTLATVDLFIQNLTQALGERNLTHIVDVIFVSDHGMTNMSHPTFLYVDEIVGQPWEGVIIRDGWPSMGLRFTSGTNTTKVLEHLYQYTLAHPGQFDVFTAESFSTDPATSSVDLSAFKHGKLNAGLQPMPERYHFSANYRIAPVWIVPCIGYALTYHGDTGSMPIGNHGYDNEESSMHAIFIAHGPFSKRAKAALAARTEDQDEYLMPGFQNVEIYNLVRQLLGINAAHAAKTNGTVGFWDSYVLPDAGT